MYPNPADFCIYRPPGRGSSIHERIKGKWYDRLDEDSDRAKEMENMLVRDGAQVVTTIKDLMAVTHAGI